jgi:hypothetical protein
MDLSVRNIEDKIHTIRGVQVILDSDLAVMYQTETKYINRAVKRHPNRFPVDFAFQLNENEWNDLRFQNGTSSSKHGGRRYMQYLMILKSTTGNMTPYTELRIEAAMIAF